MEKLKSQDELLETGKYQGQTTICATARLRCELFIYAYYKENPTLDLTQSDQDGECFLHKAIRSSYGIEFIKKLLDKGVSAIINSGNDFRHTPLDIAIFEDNRAVVPLLLNDYSAIIDDPIYLIKAAMYGYDAIVSFLLSHGADQYINSSDNHFGTPLHAAAFSGDLDTLKIILEQGGDKNIHNVMANKETLHRLIDEHYSLCPIVV